MAREEVIKRLVTQLGIKVDEKKMKRFQKRLGGIRKGLAGTARFAKSASKAIAGLALATAAVGLAVFKLADSVSKAGDKFAKTSKAIGISVENLQEFKFAAERSGSSGDMFVKAIVRMGKAIDDVRVRGTGPLAEQLELLGVGIEEFEGLKPEEAFTKLADVIAGIEDKMKRSAVAQDAFGKSGAQLIPLLLEGSEGIAKLREEAQKHADIMSTEEAQASEVLQDRILEMNAAFGKLKTRIGVELIPTVTKYVIKIRDWVATNGKLLAQKVPEIIERIIVLLQQLGPFVLKVVGGLNKLIDTFGGLDKAIIAIVGTLGALKLAVLATTSPWAALGIAAVAAGAAIATAMLGADEEFQKVQANIRKTRKELDKLKAENAETRAVLAEGGTAEKRREKGRRLSASIVAEEEARKRAVGLDPKRREQVALEAGRLVQEKGVSPALAVDLAIRREEKRRAAPKPRRRGGRRTTGGGGGRAAAPADEKEAPRSLQDLIGAPASSMLGEERQRAPVSISVTNNNFDIDAPISITGVPGEDRQGLAERVSDGLRDVLVEAAQNLQPVRVR